MAPHEKDSWKAFAGDSRTPKQLRKKKYVHGSSAPSRPAFLENWCADTVNAEPIYFDVRITASKTYNIQRYTDFTVRILLHEAI